MMDGGIIAPGGLKQPIDAEALLQWAIGQTGHLPWRGTSERELAFDHGYDAVPKRCSREYRGGMTLLKRAVDDDAAAVIAAVMALDPQIASVIIACARQKIRPDWMDGVEPRLVAVGTKRHKKSHRRVPRMAWHPCDPAAIRAAREIYQRWHAGVRGVAATVHGALDAWQINGFGASAAPWDTRPEKTA